MGRRFIALLERQLAVGFPDVAGAEVTITLPISDRLLNQLVTEGLPPGSAVRELDMRARADNRFAVRVKFGSSPFLPAISLAIAIERQPDLPSSPELVLRLEMGRLMAFAGPALRFLDKLPPGIRIDGENVHVNLATLLAQRGLDAALEFLEELRITTVEGATVVSLRARVRPPT